MKTTQTPKIYFLRNLFGFPQTLYIMVSDKRWANRIYSETTSHCFNLKFCQKNKTLRYSLTNHIFWQFINAIQSWYKKVPHTDIHTVQNKYLAVLIKYKPYTMLAATGGNHLNNLQFQFKPCFDALETDGRKTRPCWWNTTKFMKNPL